MKAVGYIRVSSKEQARSGLGLEAQQQHIEQYAKTNGLQLAGIFSDPGISGAKPIEKRPGLQQAIGATRRGWQLVVSDIDRLARDHDLYGYINYKLKQKKVRIISTKGQGTDIEGGAGKLMTSFSTVQSDELRQKIREKTREALEVKRAKGEKTGGTIPIGYRISGYVTKTRKLGMDIVEYRVPSIEKDPEQKILKTIQRYRAKGLPMREIVKRLNARKIDGRNNWHLTTIHGIINREGY